MRTNISAIAPSHAATAAAATASSSSLSPLQLKRSDFAIHTRTDTDAYTPLPSAPLPAFLLPSLHSSFPHRRRRHRRCKSARLPAAAAARTFGGARAHRRPCARARNLDGPAPSLPPSDGGTRTDGGRDDNCEVAVVGQCISRRRDLLRLHRVPSFLPSAAAVKADKAGKAG